MSNKDYNNRLVYTCYSLRWLFDTDVLNLIILKI